jgi:hypothetical protein
MVRKKYLLGNKCGTCQDLIEVVCCPTCTIHQEFQEVGEKKKKVLSEAPSSQSMS